MRLFGGTALAVIGLLLTSCSATHMVSDEALSNAEDAANRVSDASSALDQDVARFDSEDWQDVVPDVREHQQELAAAQDDLQAAVAEMKKD